MELLNEEWKVKNEKWNFMTFRKVDYIDNQQFWRVLYKSIWYPPSKFIDTIAQKPPVAFPHSEGYSWFKKCLNEL